MLQYNKKLSKRGARKFLTKVFVESCEHKLLKWFNEFKKEFNKGKPLYLPDILTVSNRMSKSGGYFSYNHKNKTTSIKISMKHWEAFGDKEVKDTLKHEMVHFWEWINFRKVGHGKNFLDMAKHVGASRHCSKLPTKMFKHVYVCPNCKYEVGTNKRYIRRHSCYFCSQGKFNSKFEMNLKEE